MNKLTWPDIYTQASELNFESLLKLWPNTISGPLRPIGASAFGDLYFERPNGQVERLDVLEGGTHLIAKSIEEFGVLMNSPEWQQQNLLTEGVALLLEKGIGRGLNQFFGFAPHPTFTGRVDWSRVTPLDAEIWHTICSQVLDTPA